jgi:putative two-component system response regulator
MAGMFSKKILVIEDEPTLSDILIRKLTLAGYDAYHAETGPTGIESIRKNKPDLVLLDMMLLGVSGMDILQEIRNDDTIKYTKVIIISNSGQPVEIEKALELGAKDYLIKAQFDPDEVLEKVRMQLHDEKGSEKKTIAGKKVLIVEDDKFLRDLLSRKMESEGVQLFVGVDGAQGLNLAEREKPNVMLLDILMPGMDGYAVLESVRKNPELKDTVVIMLSNFGQKEDIEKATKLGANLFLVKAAVTLDEIIEKVKEFLV